MSIAITTLIKFKKMKKIIYFLIALSPMLAWAQQNVITYNPVDKQVLLTEVNAENNLETLVVIDEQDFNTVQYDKDGRVTELTNSSGTLAFESPAYLKCSMLMVCSGRVALRSVAMPAQSSISLRRE